MDKAAIYNERGHSSVRFKFPRTAVIGILLVIALFAFEIFNFDTTRYALRNLLGDVNFGGLRWATILAIAFCAIDFAGLARLFTPEQGQDEPKAVWYLMGAWLLGATMNALMTWWAISLTLLSHDFGNEVMSRGQLLQIVPVFVATLVWLTRILFIGAFSMAGEAIFALDRPYDAKPVPTRQPATTGLKLVRNREAETAVPRPQRPAPNAPAQPRIQRRPPMPHHAPQAPVGMHARGRQQR
jgi:hypothetical protein